MLEQRRVQPAIFDRKPKVVLDKRFKFARELTLGDKGQLKALLRIKDIELVKDADLNEIKKFIIVIDRAEVFEPQEVRVDKIKVI